MLSVHFKRLRWSLIAACAAALISASGARAGHDGTNVFHLGQTNTFGSARVVGAAPGADIGYFEQTAATTTLAGVYGLHSNASGAGPGVYGETMSTSAGGVGVYGVHFTAAGANAAGVSGLTFSNAANAAGVRGQNNHSSCCGMGVAGFHLGQGIGVYGESLEGFAVSGFSPDNWSGYFQGSVRVVGNLQKNSGSFTIDHPLDPANKYLSHSFVESPDMKNVYDGVVRTDKRGFATVKLPRYFSALNRSVRYQLTILGRRGWNARVVREIANGRFTIQTDAPRMRVSWQVTGIRKDRWANAHRIVVEEAKKPSERGRYLNPELYGKAATKSVVVLPGMDGVPARTPRHAQRPSQQP